MIQKHTTPLYSGAIQKTGRRHYIELLEVRANSPFLDNGNRTATNITVFDSSYSTGTDIAVFDRLHDTSVTTRHLTGNRSPTNRRKTDNQQY